MLTTACVSQAAVARMSLLWQPLPGDMPDSQVL